MITVKRDISNTTQNGRGYTKYGGGGLLLVSEEAREQIGG
jgi:hypothetical protein